MAEKDSTTNRGKVKLCLTLDQANTLSLKLSEARAMADVLQLAVEGDSEPEPENLAALCAMLFNHLSDISRLFNEATDEKAPEKEAA